MKDENKYSDELADQMFEYMRSCAKYGMDSVEADTISKKYSSEKFQYLTHHFSEAVKSGDIDLKQDRSSDRLNRLNRLKSLLKNIPNHRLD